MSSIISDMHDNDINYSTKTIFFFMEVNRDNVERLLKNLHILDQTTGPITIKLSTGGGDVSAGLAAVDAIASCKNHVNIVCYEGVSSMGTVILQSADQRYMTPNSYLMVHEGESGVIANTKDREQWLKLMEHQDEVCIQMYLKKIKEVKPRFSKKKLLDLLDRDRILLPKEAIELGLADEIIGVY